MRVLIVYDSETRNTEKMAFAVSEGVKEIEGVDIQVKKVDKTTKEDLQKAMESLLVPQLTMVRCQVKSRPCLTSRSRFMET